MRRVISGLISMVMFGIASAQTPVTVFEFYNTTLKQYFRTGDAGEAASIDRGAAGPGWVRTGDNFSLWQAGQTTGGLVDVCRFYGSQNPGPNSHFFTASAAECASLKTLQAQTPITQKRWNFEGIAFAAKLPGANGCAVGTVPIYRSYNQGAQRGIDSNHRFTSQKSEYDRVNAGGWAGEGVVMCACDSASDARCVSTQLLNLNTTTSAKRIVDSILIPKCLSCHQAGAAFATQSGLTIDPANAWQPLINRVPKNADAAKHGITMLKPGNASESFIFTKLMQWDPKETHQFGAPMPLGSQSLSVGELEFVRRWINEGASETSDTISPSLLADTTAPSYAPFTALEQPKNGFQIRMEPFSVQPNFEREIFVYRKVGNPAPVYVNRIDYKMRTNSHHFVMYALDPNTPAFAMPIADTVRDLRDPSNNLVLGTALTMGYHIYLAGSTTPQSSYTFPTGVALELPANMGIDLNLHYVNQTNSPIQGEAYANFEVVDRATVKNVARTLNLNNTNLTLPPNQRTTINKTFTFTETRNIIMLTSHSHKYGEKFVIRIAGGARNGQIIYESLDWEHPIAKTFDPPLVLAPGEGLTSEVTYNNTSTRTIKFGLTSEDEMDIIFGYYY